MEILGTGTIVGALYGAAGAIVVKYLDGHFRLREKTTELQQHSKDKSIDVESELRDELRARVCSLEERLKATEEQSDIWRKRYYEQYEAFMEQRITLRKYQALYGRLDDSSIEKKPQGN